jgi:hypothetical protein
MRSVKIIGVIGGASCTREIEKIAFRVGQEIARRGAILICGGLSGVMEAACKGAKNGGGTTVGVLPGKNRRTANPYVDIPIVTGMDIARNVILVRSSDAVIAIDGRYGTLSEIVIAFSLGVPVIGLKTWEITIPIKEAETPEQAVEMAMRLAG